MWHNAYPKAAARIRGGREYPELCGMVRFFPCCDGTVLEVEITGLPRTEKGFFGFHIHEGGRCAGESLSETGSHLNPNQMPHPGHAGDLPPLFSDRGRAYMKVFTDRFCVEDVVGRTVVIHSSPDDFHTQPAGNAGSKIACGLIRRV